MTFVATSNKKDIMLAILIEHAKTFGHITGVFPHLLSYGLFFFLI
jgi:hypothetical protein